MNHQNQNNNNNPPITYVEHFIQGHTYPIRPRTIYPLRTGQHIPPALLPLTNEVTECRLDYYNYGGDEVTVHVGPRATLRLPLTAYADEVNFNVRARNPNADLFVFPEAYMAGNHANILHHCMLPL